MKRKEKILEWSRNRVDTNSGNSITNWHLSDDILEFIDEFYNDKNTTIKQGIGSFNRYAKMLVEEGYLCNPERIGLESGGYSEFGTRTQTIWRKNHGFESYHQKLKGLSYSRYEFDYFKKHGKFPKKRED
jgi:hypothetical protein